MMRSLSPSCFAPPEPADPAVIASSKCNTSQNLVTCIYQLLQQDDDEGAVPSFLTLTWSNTRLGHSLTVHLRCSACTIDISPPSPLRLFRSNRRGSHSLGPNTKLFWSFARALFNNHGPEPTSNFYLCLVSHGRLGFLLGDLFDDAIRHANLSNCGISNLGPQRFDLYSSKQNPAKQAAVAKNNVLINLVSRREHVFGRHSYATMARFGGSGREHEIGIECKGGDKGKEARLVVKVDGESVLMVKRLVWKFRGNQRVVVDESTVENFWDVYNWVFNGGGHAVFIFQEGGGLALGGVWPEFVMKGPEKKLLRKSASSSTESASSVLQWKDGDSGIRSSNNSGFSLLLYAWRREK